MDSPLEEPRTPSSDLKACMNFKWTDELTLQFILYRHERRHFFTKKRNTSRYGWQQILRDMGLSPYVTPYQAQKKWNNLWSKYKSARKGQVEGGMEDDPNSSWPFFTVLDAIAMGKTVTITNPAVGPFQGLNDCTPTIVTGTGTVNPSSIPVTDEPLPKKLKMDDSMRSQSWDGESEDRKQHVVELLQANLHQLDEIKVSIETQGQAIISMLSQLIHIVSNGSKSSHASNNPNGANRIDDAITATIREIGISQENI